MTDNQFEKTSKAGNTELLDTFQAPYAEREHNVEAPRTGLVLFSFGRGGGFRKPGDKGKKEGFSVA